MGNWKHQEMTNDELKKLVREVYDMKFFTSLQCDGYMTMSVFMPLMFLGSPPSKPSFPEKVDNIRKDRKNKLLHFDALEQWEKDMKQWEDETSIREEYINNIGMLYEDMNQAGPRSINGYPIFMSMKIVSKSDTQKFIEMYNKYLKMREEFENEW